MTAEVVPPILSRAQVEAIYAVVDGAQNEQAWRELLNSHEALRELLAALVDEIEVAAALGLANPRYGSLIRAHAVLAGGL
jgi:hypothetical protein